MRGGPRTPTGDPANSGRAPLRDKHLSHAAASRGMAGAQPFAPGAPGAPAAAPRRAERGADGPAEESGDRRPGGIAGRRAGAAGSRSEPRAWVRLARLSDS